MIKSFPINSSQKPSASASSSASISVTVSFFGVSSAVDGASSFFSGISSNDTMLNEYDYVDKQREGEEASEKLFRTTGLTSYSVNVQNKYSLL
jgi:hypothetical protein